MTFLLPTGIKGLKHFCKIFQILGTLKIYEASIKNRYFKHSGVLLIQYAILPSKRGLNHYLFQQPIKQAIRVQMKIIICKFRLLNPKLFARKVSEMFVYQHT